MADWKPKLTFRPSAMQFCLNVGQAHIFVILLMVTFSSSQNKFASKPKKYGEASYWGCMTNAEKKDEFTRAELSVKAGLFKDFEIKDAHLNEEGFIREDLSHYFLPVIGMDVSVCVRMCHLKEYQFAALFRGERCVCSKGPLDHLVETNQSFCYFRCPVNCRQRCGGRSALSLYYTGGMKKPEHALIRVTFLNDYHWLWLDKAGVDIKKDNNITFKVKCCRELHVALSEAPEDKSKMYVLVIGSHSNSRSEVRRGKSTNLVSVHHKPLSCTELRDFWVMWGTYSHRMIRMGYGDRVGKEEFLSYRDTSTHKSHVNYIGVTGHISKNDPGEMIFFSSVYTDWQHFRPYWSTQELIKLDSVGQDGGPRFPRKGEGVTTPNTGKTGAPAKFAEQVAPGKRTAWVTSVETPSHGQLQELEEELKEVPTFVGHLGLPWNQEKRQSTKPRIAVTAVVLCLLAALVIATIVYLCKPHTKSTPDKAEKQAGPPGTDDQKAREAEKEQDKTIKKEEKKKKKKTNDDAWMDNIDELDDDQSNNASNFSRSNRIHYHGRYGSDKKGERSLSNAHDETYSSSKRINGRRPVYVDSEPSSSSYMTLTDFTSVPYREYEHGNKTINSTLNVREIFSSGNRKKDMLKHAQISCAANSPVRTCSVSDGGDSCSQSQRSRVNLNNCDLFSDFDIHSKKGPSPESFQLKSMEYRSQPTSDTSQSSPNRSQNRRASPSQHEALSSFQMTSNASPRTKDSLQHGSFNDQAGEDVTIFSSVPGPSSYREYTSSVDDSSDSCQESDSPSCKSKDSGSGVSMTGDCVCYSTNNNTKHCGHSGGHSATEANCADSDTSETRALIRR